MFGRPDGKSEGFLGAVRAKDVRRDHFFGWMLLTVACMYFFSFGHLGSWRIHESMFLRTWLLFFFVQGVGVIDQNMFHSIGSR